MHVIMGFFFQIMNESNGNACSIYNDIAVQSSSLELSRMFPIKAESNGNKPT